jgi:hypothetical protein
MKIDLDIPDELIEKGRTIHVLAGMERIAYKLDWEDKWKVKYSRCNKCGLCCKRLKCPHLKEDNTCGKGLEMPYICLVTEPYNVPECTSLYREVD